jgi:prepilin-type N-terminal cleavage/methylation domain-containing protein
MVTIRGRRGLTLIELLVVMAVIGLLVALLIPAVQASREAALRARCANNLRQIGLAIQHHAEAMGAFPAGIGAMPGPSYLVQILPYLEQRPLYDALNMSTDDLLCDENATVLRQTPDSFLCPADVGRTTQSGRAVNYAANAGRDSVRGEGVFIGRPIRPGDIADGLAQTAGVAEWLVGPGLTHPDAMPGRFDRLRFQYRLARVYSDRPEDIDAFIHACEALSPSDVDFRTMSASKGQFWINGGLGVTQYNHMLRPNRPSCSAPENAKAVSASSTHGGAAHVLTMDGSVRPVKDSVDSRVWSAAGTRSGGETVNGDAF